MTDLTRRRRSMENFESWDVLDGDVTIGSLSKINGTGIHVLWQWTCGFYPGCDKRTQQTGGNEDTFHEAKERLQESWDRLKPKVTPAMRTEWLEHQAFTAWKYAMSHAHCKMPTQSATGRSHCFCGTEITIADAHDHVRVSHMH